MAEIRDIAYCVPTDDSYWTSDTADAPLVENAVANCREAVDLYLRQRFPGAEISVGSSPHGSCAINGDRTCVQAADLAHEIEADVDWSDEALWETDPGEFDPEAFLAKG